MGQITTKTTEEHEPFRFSDPGPDALRRPVSLYIITQPNDSFMTFVLVRALGGNLTKRNFYYAKTAGFSSMRDFATPLSLKPENPIRKI
jgi:hypothetical protein